MSKASPQQPGTTYTDLTADRMRDPEAPRKAATASAEENPYEIPVAADDLPRQEEAPNPPPRPSLDAAGENLYEIPVQQEEEVAPNPPPRPSLAEANQSSLDEYQEAATSAQKLSAEFLQSKQENAGPKYGEVSTLFNDLSSGKTTQEEALKKLQTIGEGVSDKGLNAFLKLMKLIFEKCEGEELKKAGKSAIDNFSYLSGENKEPLENLMKAADKITNDETISADFRQQMSDSLAADVFQKQEKEAEKTKPESKTAAPSQSSASSFFGKKELINAFKGAVAIGLTAGFPPAGWALSLGFLYLTKDWGNDKEKDQKEKETKLKEFESKMEQVKGMGARTKEATAGVAQETGAEIEEAGVNLASVANANETPEPLQEQIAEAAAPEQEASEEANLDTEAEAAAPAQETSAENARAAATTLDSAAKPSLQDGGEAAQETATTPNLDGGGESINREGAMSEVGALVEEATREQDGEGVNAAALNHAPAKSRRQNEASTSV
jgi:hypothetical protein